MLVSIFLGVISRLILTVVADEQKTKHPFWLVFPTSWAHEFGIKDINDPTDIAKTCDALFKTVWKGYDPENCTLKKYDKVYNCNQHKDVQTSNIGDITPTCSCWRRVDENDSNLCDGFSGAAVVTNKKGQLDPGGIGWWNDLEGLLLWAKHSRTGKALESKLQHKTKWNSPNVIFVESPTAMDAKTCDDAFKLSWKYYDPPKGFEETTRSSNVKCKRDPAPSKWYRCGCRRERTGHSDMSKTIEYQTSLTREYIKDQDTYIWQSSVNLPVVQLDSDNLEFLGLPCKAKDPRHKCRLRKTAKKSKPVASKSALPFVDDWMRTTATRTSTKTARQAISTSNKKPHE